MTKAELDYIRGTMLDSQKNVSDLNITAAKPLQVESSGELVGVTIDPPVDKLTPFQTETIALNIINRNRRLTEDLIKTGSCDCSYALGQKARFRVNIFTQRGHHTIILRRLSTEIPSVDPSSTETRASTERGFLAMACRYAASAPFGSPSPVLA